MASILLFQYYVKIYSFSNSSTKFILLTILSITAIILLSSTQLHAEFHSLPHFQNMNKAAVEESFGPILKAYRENNYRLALAQTHKLLDKTQDPSVAEAAMFWVADLEYEIATTGKRFTLNRALTSYQEAVTAYPSSENSVRAYWKIGGIYREMQFFYESIASHRRVLSHQPKSRFAPLAQRGIARTYSDWGKLIQASWEYRNTYRLDLPPSEIPITLVEYVDVLFQLGRFEGFYKLYQEALNRYPQLIQEQPEAMFRFGESAFWTKRFPEARNIFTKFFNIHPQEPLHFVALVRVGDSWRHEANAENAEWIYSQVRSMKSKSLNWQIADLVLRIGQFPILGCCPPPPLEIFAPKRLPEVEIEIIKERALSSLTDEPISTTVHRILYEAGILLKDHGFLIPSIQIFKRLHESNPAPLIRKRLATLLQETVAEAVTQHAESEEYQKVIGLFFNYPAAFTERMLNGTTGLNLANSFFSIGLYRQAIDLYLPLTKDRKSPLRETALFRLVKTYHYYGKPEETIRTVKKFLSNYPKSKRVPEALFFQGKAFRAQSQYSDAIRIYQSFLKRFPKHGSGEEVYLHLADAYSSKGSNKKALSIYQRLLKKRNQTSPDLSLKIADAYQKTGKHQKAIEFYKLTLGLDPESSSNEWIQLQMALSYELLDQKHNSQDLLQKLAQGDKDPLIREFSGQKVNPNP